MKRRYNLLAAFILLIAFTINSYGQSAGFTLISTDARTFGLGGNSTAVVSNAFGFYNNSASLVFSADKGALAASYSSWMPQTMDNSIVAGSGFFKIGKKSAISFGYNNFAYQEVEIIDQFGSGRGMFTPKESLFGAGFSYMLSNNFSASANLKFISSDIGGNDAASAFAADLNLFYQKESLNLGFSLSNIGSSLDYGNGPHSLPSNAKIGASYIKNVSDNSTLLFTGQAGMVLKESALMAGAGLEYAFKQILFLRIGAHYGDEEKSIPSYLSVGTGLKIYGINLDFAYLTGKSDSPLGNSFCISMGYNF
ncbi:MAG: PorV/PorQ family protein [Bacteroidales bacterium]|jgi:hypothetical protein